MPIRRYIIASDRGAGRKFTVDQMGLGDIVKTEVKLKIWSRRPRDYTVGVAVMRETDNAIGEFTTVTLKNVRGTEMPGPTKLTIRKLTPRGIYGLLEWEIPDDIADEIKGFRIYSMASIYMGPGKDRVRTGEELLYDETKVTAKMRSFRVGPHMPRSEYWYFLEVVSKGGLVSDRQEKYAYFKPLRCREYDSPEYRIQHPAPNFKAEFVEDPAGPDYIHVSWGKLPEDDAELVEAFEVDLSPRNACAGRLPLKTTRFEMRIPLRDRFSGKLDVSMELLHCFGRRVHKQTVTIVIPKRVAAASRTGVAGGADLALIDQLDYWALSCSRCRDICRIAAWIFETEEK